MNFNLTSPCSNCPFVRSAFEGLPESRRQEIADALLTGDKSFTCHKTISGETDDQGDYHPGMKDQQCAGAMIWMAKQDRLWDNRVFRFAAIVGWLKPDRLKMDANTYESVEEFVEGE